MPAEGLKWRVNRAVRACRRLPSPARTIMFVLSDMADAQTAEIPAGRTPSTAQLADETGLKESTVKKHRALLEALGWLTVTRPTVAEAARHVPSRYALKIGRDESGSHQTTPAGGHETTPEVDDRGSRNDPREPDRGSPDDPPGGHEVTAAGVTRRPPSHIDDRNDLTTAAADATATADGALFAAPPVAPKPETEGQRVYRLAHTYTDRVTLSNYNAVAGIVKKAVRTTDERKQPLYTDGQIIAGLERLITENRSVTAEALRIAIEGKPRSTPPVYKNPATNTGYHAKWRPRSA